MLRMGFIGQGSITSVHYAGYRNLKEEGFEISVSVAAQVSLVKHFVVFLFQLAEYAFVAGELLYALPEFRIRGFSK